MLTTRNLLGSVLMAGVLLLSPAFARAETPALPVPQAQPAACAATNALAGDVSSLRLQVTTLCLMNGDRVRAGLQPLHFSTKLSRAAMCHARNMTARGYFGHNEPSGVT